MIQNVIQPKFGDGAVKEGVWKCDVCLLALWLLCSLNPLYPGQARTRALLCSACHLRIERKKASPFLHIPYATVGRKKSSPLCYRRCAWLCSPCCQSRGVHCCPPPPSLYTRPLHCPPPRRCCILPLDALPAALFPLVAPHASAESPSTCNCCAPSPPACQAPHW